MDILKTIADKKVIIFELDDLIYPKRDYDLQVYYLFANFIEFTEGYPASADLVSFAKQAYEAHGALGIFERMQEAFGLGEQYREQLQRLYANAQLPLKLFLFEDIKNLFEQLIQADKKIVILTAGNPVEKLNKIKHIAWDTWAKDLKVYFQDELNFRNIQAAEFIASEFNVTVADLHFFSERHGHELISKEL